MNLPRALRALPSLRVNNTPDKERYTTLNSYERAAFKRLASERLGGSTRVDLRPSLYTV